MPFVHLGYHLIHVVPTYGTITCRPLVVFCSVRAFLLFLPAITTVVLIYRSGSAGITCGYRSTWVYLPPACILGACHLPLPPPLGACHRYCRAVCYLPLEVECNSAGYRYLLPLPVEVHAVIRFLGSACVRAGPACLPAVTTWVPIPFHVFWIPPFGCSFWVLPFYRCSAYHHYLPTPAFHSACIWNTWNATTWAGRCHHHSDASPPAVLPFIVILPTDSGILYHLQIPAFHR